MSDVHFTSWHDQSTHPPIFIAVIGMTGVGKSTFVKNLTLDDKIEIGRGLYSCTKDVRPARMVYTDSDGQSHDVYLVDTPGFDDTEISDRDVLSNLADWLAIQHERELKLSGIIYFHRITDDRMTGSALRNLNLMRNLCGEENMKNVVLVTSRWESVKDWELAEEKEHNELLAPGRFWYGMIQQGARHTRHNGTRESALAIIDRLIHQAPIYLAIQEELAQGKALAETAAANAALMEQERQALEESRAHEEMRLAAEQAAIQAAEQAAQNAALLAEEAAQNSALLAEEARRFEEAQAVLRTEQAALRAQQERMQAEQAFLRAVFSTGQAADQAAGRLAWGRRSVRA